MNNPFVYGTIFHAGSNGGMPLGRQEHYAKWIKATKDMGADGLKMLLFDDAYDPESQAMLAVRKCIDNGLVVVARLFREMPNPGTLTSNHIKVAKTLVSFGSRFIEFNNEPNLTTEWKKNASGVQEIPSYAPTQVAADWLVDAQRIIDVGGYPAIPAMAPGGNWDDGDFYKKMLLAMKPKMTKSLLDNLWVACHNYTSNKPLDYPYDAINVAEKGTVDILAPGESNGFLKPIMLGEVFKQVFGFYPPVIGTEGGPVIDPGFSPDPRYPKVMDEAIHASVATESYKWMINNIRVPSYFWANCLWLLGNRSMENYSNAGFEEHAYFPFWKFEEGRLAVRAMIEMPKHPRVIDVPVKPVDLETLRNSAWNKPKGGEVIAYNADLAFPKYAREHNLGIPLTNEWQVGQYTLQCFAMGIVYCITGKWAEVTHMAY